MAHDVVAFLGPTLRPAEARQELDALFLPPAGNGDILRAVLDHAPKAIALVDGVFAQSPAVRHKEILWALSRGVRVYGASSMGAVRAAELGAYGMVGYGLIFRWYRRTMLADDADVAVAMTPAQLGSLPLGDALVDIRLTLKRAERDGIIGRDTRTALERCARGVHYSERSYDRLIRDAQGISWPQLSALEQWLAHGKRMQKAADARGLFRLLSSQAWQDDAPRAEFEPTEAFCHDMAYYDLARWVLPATDR